MQRPTSSAGGRPVTSSGRPPSTAGRTHFGFESSAGYYPEEDLMEEDEEEESSEDEDVFAFLPPTTADGTSHNNHDDTTTHHPQQTTDDNRFSSSPPPTYPQPAYTPNTRYPPSTADVPLTANSEPFAHQQPISPPSTMSHHDDNNPYRLKRLHTGDVLPPATTTTSSRSVKVSLPPGSEKDLEGGSIIIGKRSAHTHTSGTVQSDIMSMSYIEPDEESRDDGSIKMEFDFGAIEEDSPFPEVRASVSNTDDPDVPALTLRMWVVGLLLCIISSALNVFFSLRSPAPTIVPLALMLIAYPCGKFLSLTLPIRTYRIPLPRIPSFCVPPPSSNAIGQYIHNALQRASLSTHYDCSLNPGPWNMKEHVLVYIMANVAVGTPYALNAVIVSEVYYGIKLDYWFALTLVLATQLTGFGLAGICRRFLVWPASMVWPQNLVACTLLNTLHAEEDADEYVPEADGTLSRPGVMGGVTRYKYFMWTTGGAFAFFFLPGFLFQALSIFSFICWAAPNNVVVNQLFGVRSGMGMSVLTFDWTQISWIGSPLMYPWWAQVHIFTGFVLFFWIMTPILYYTNSWQSAYFPMYSNQPYDRFGGVYDIRKVLNPDQTFNMTAYEEYSPLYLPATYAVCYLIAFAMATCVITHTLLYHGKTLYNGVRRIKVEQDDIHAKLMRSYPEVPDWWYVIVGLVFFGLAVVAVEVWHTNVPVWALLIALLLPVVYMLPSGFIYAMTGQGITLNILAQIIPGSIVPGNPLANMVFKAYSVQTLTEATSFVQDLKLGHYMKVPPRATFLVQLVSTIMAAFVQVGVKTWIFANVHDICDDDQVSRLTCPHTEVFFTASAVWGLIGPRLQFGVGSIYYPFLYALIVGALLPLPFWFWQRRYPNSWTKYVSTPVLLNGVSFIPPATGINYSSWFVVGFVFQYLIRKKNFAWWNRFNYVTSAAMDCGTVISLMVIFFTLQFPKHGRIAVRWWGNEVFVHTADYMATPYLSTPPGGIP